MTYSVKQISERYEAGEHTVLKWIQAGDLAAVNVARETGGKPRWRITPEALQAFELSRSAMPALPSPSRRRRSVSDVVEFYR